VIVSFEKFTLHALAILLKVRPAAQLNTFQRYFSQFKVAEILGDRLGVNHLFTLRSQDSQVEVLLPLLRFLIKLHFVVDPFIEPRLLKLLNNVAGHVL